MGDIIVYQYVGKEDENVLCSDGHPDTDTVLKLRTQTAFGA